MSKKQGSIDSEWIKRARKARAVREKQMQFCQFVDIQFPVIQKKQGNILSYTLQKDHGLQLLDTVFLLDGKIKSIYTKGMRIIKRYDSIPIWTPKLLRD